MLLRRPVKCRTSRASPVAGRTDSESLRSDPASSKRRRDRRDGEQGRAALEHHALGHSRWPWTGELRTDQEPRIGVGLLGDRVVVNALNRPRLPALRPRAATVSGLILLSSAS